MVEKNREKSWGEKGKVGKRVLSRLIFGQRERGR
jgi:hypothetical protein